MFEIASKEHFFELNEVLPIFLISLIRARMAELADALDSGSSGRKVVGVQVPVRAHKQKNHRYGGFFVFNLGKRAKGHAEHPRYPIYDGQNRIR